MRPSRTLITAFSLAFALSPSAQRSAFPPSTATPSSTLIAFEWHFRPDNPTPHIWTVDPSNPSTLSQLTFSQYEDLFPVWGPDGRSLVFTRFDRANGQMSLWTVQADGSHEIQITPWETSGSGAIVPHFWYTNDPAGYRIYLKTSIQSDPIFWAYSDGPSSQSLNAVAGSGGMLQPDISPDETKVVAIGGGRILVAALSASGNAVDNPITVFASPNPTLPEITGELTAPEWSPNGERIAFGAGEGHRKANIYAIDALTGGNPMKLSFFGGAAEHASWSPDSSWIAAHESSAPASHIFVFPADGSFSPAIQLTTGAVTNYAPDWQPFPFTPVEIDIKPGSEENCLNSDGHGVIPVAILSTPTLDATQVDPTTVTLDGQSVRIVGSGNLQVHVQDVDADGLPDLLVQIEDTDGTYAPGSAIATLRATTFQGLRILGTDSICVVP